MLHDDRPKKPHGSVPLPHHTETLKSIAARLRKTMGDAQCGLTSVAVEVMSLASDWGRHKAEAGGLEIGRWARKELHPTWRMNKYRELAEAAERAGPFWNRIPSNALLWMHNQIPAEDAFNAALKDVSALFNKQGKRPPTLGQVRTVANRFCIAESTRETLREKLKAAEARIERLEAQVRAGCKAGTEPVV
jgi:hypothetical protein